ncbi:unnamed protein product [Cylicostephanus goldi]|uniref:Major facilitator superfamily (MFS) profile domain-containing protein n=1 Tax=Cylicostephanus goldi TaxID=71465 RepID=A0A3P7M2Z5_CYLGO|nr:unnamed protein product [Cylicostephanus goldi]
MASLEKFHIIDDIDIQHLPIVYLLYKTKSEVEPTTHHRPRADYEDIDQGANQEAQSLKLVLLCAVVACIATVLHSLFPFLLLAHEGGALEYQIFLPLCSSNSKNFQAAMVLGRFVAVLLADKVASYFYMGISIIGCGAACCAFTFDRGLWPGSALFGFFLSTLLPSMIVYIRHTLSLPAERIFALMSGSSMGHVIYPLFLTLANSSESRIFIAIDFFAILLLVLLYVSILNVQAQTERTGASQDSIRIFIDRFFSGEAMLKRTRSLRPLISRLRPNSYRRFRGRNVSAISHSSDVPKIEITLERKPQIQYN